MTIRRVMVWALVAIVLFAVAPLLSLLVAGGFASANGCILNEATTHPCVMAGIDFGGVLYGLSVFGWLALATVPVGGMALLIWLAVAVTLYVRRRMISARRSNDQSAAV